MSNVDTLYGSGSVYSEEEEDDPVPSFSCRCCPAWWLQRSKLFRTIITNFCIFIVIFIPGLVTRLVLTREYNILNIPIDRWTEFICLIFFGLHASRLLVYIVLKTIWYCTAGKAQTRVEMLQFVQINIALCVWSLVCLSGWHYIIKPPPCPGPGPENQCSDEVKLFSIIGNAIESLVFACFAFCVERIALTQVSTIFKKGSYHDRVVQCKFESDMIEAMLKCRHIDRVERKMAKLQSRRPSASDVFDVHSSNLSLRNNFAQVLKSQPEYPSQLVHSSSDSQFGTPSIATRISVELEEKLRKPSKAGLEIPECVLDGNSSQYGERKQWNISMTQMAKYIHQIRSKKLVNVIGSMEDANKYSKKIFLRLCPRNRTYILPEDFQRVFHSRNTQEFAFQLLDKDMDGKVTLPDMREAIRRIYRERRNLAKSLSDLESAIHKLDIIFKSITTLLLLLVTMLVFEVSVVSIVASFSSVFVSMAFILGNSAKNAFDCLVFLFIVHPFDVGDRIILNNRIYIIHKLHILTTVLERGDGLYFYIANHILAQQFIANIRRSGDMVEEIRLDCNKLTSAAQIYALRSSLQEFITRDTEIADYRSADIIIDGVLDGYRLRINIQMTCRGNFQDAGRKNRRKVRLFLFLQDQIREIGIDCRPMAVVDLSQAQDFQPNLVPDPIITEAQKLAQSVRG
ncbi:hypothetical protein BGW37DRAFT_176756 [Umbelopsis sp. PMI_123]|nr:hypothetical protein BGW37DRAFT_176756 [Umbelopsis sp. PMI_123]